MSEGSNTSEPAMRGTGAAVAGGGSGSSLSFAPCRPRTTGCTIAAASGPATGQRAENEWAVLFMNSLPLAEQRPRLGRVRFRLAETRLLRAEASDRVLRSRRSDVLLRGRLLVVVLGDRLRSGAAGPDLDPARLHGLGHLTHELNRQQAMLQPGSAHLDVVCQVE